VRAGGGGARSPAGRRPGDAGLTVVEILITIIVASLIAAGTFTFFAGQQRVYDTQTKMLGVQQSLWSSMDAVTRYVRSSGAGMSGCVRADNDASGVDTGDPPPGGPTPPQTGLRAYRAGAATRIAPLWIINGVDGAPDTLTVAFGQGASGNFKDASLASTVPLGRPTAPVVTLPGQSARFVPGEFILLVDEASTSGDRGCTLFRVTSILADGLIRDPGVSSFNPGGDTAELVPFPYNGGSAVATGGIRNFGQLVWLQLAITPGVGTAAPSLTMDRLDDGLPPQLLAEGIEDMQIAYACDLGPGTIPDGIINEGTDPGTRRNDEWIYNEAGDVEPLRCQRPDAIRITLIARTLTPDDTLSDISTNRRPAVEDGVVGAPDRFRHRAMSATVRLRN
jgi:hypothetical protein